MATSLALYTLADEYLQAAERLADLDLDEQTVADTLEGLQGAVEVKATNVGMFIRNLEAGADAIRQAEAHMAARRKAMENRAARIKSYLLLNMTRTGINKIESPHLNIVVKDNPPAVVIDSLQAVPDDYMRHPEPPPAAPDKKLIAQAIKDGFEVPGCHLERTKRVDIK